MKSQSFKAFLILYFFFLLDLIKPFGHYFLAEFLVLGFILVSLNSSLFSSLIFAIVFGYFRSVFLPRELFLSLIELPILSLIIYYLNLHLKFSEARAYLVTSRNLIALIAICLHIIFNSLISGNLFPIFTLQLLIQSFFAYLLIGICLRKQQVL
jgi:hypothetical protein